MSSLTKDFRCSVGGAGQAEQRHAQRCDAGAAPSLAADFLLAREELNELAWLGKTIESLIRC